MSNEYKEWLNDKVIEILFDANVIDKIDKILPTPIYAIKYVHGWKNNEQVAFAVWYDEIGEEWRFERRELNAE